MPGRRDEVLDAGIEVLGAGGIRRLTYQAVDAAAGAPAGTTSNHFRSRDLLVEGIVQHMAALDARDWESFARAPAPGSPDALAEALSHTIRNVLGPARSRTAARYALLLEGIARPAVREPLSRARVALIDLTSKWLEDLGSPAPRDHCRILFDYLDGLMFRQLCLPQEAFDPTAAIRTILDAFLPPPSK